MIDDFRLDSFKKPGLHDLSLQVAPELRSQQLACMQDTLSVPVYRKLPQHIWHTCGNTCETLPPIAESPFQLFVNS